MTREELIYIKTLETDLGDIDVFEDEFGKEFRFKTDQEVENDECA